MQLNLLTKNRNALMGTSILFIILCHNSLRVNDIFDILNGLMRIFLQIGVDIFLLLSAIGCCYSYNKLNGDIFTFYRKRFSRILPTYFFVIFFYGIFSCVIMKKDIWFYIYKFSLVSFYISGFLVQWFIAAILVLYLLFPKFHKFYKKDMIGFYFFISIIILFSFMFSIFDINLQSLKMVNEIFLSRVPIFLIGIIIGENLYLNKELKVGKRTIILLIILLMLFVSANFLFNNINMWVVMRLIYCPLSIILSLILSCIINLNKTLNVILNFFGQITLELYLIHEKMMEITYLIGKNIFLNEKYILLFSNFSAIILAIVVAVIVHKIIDRINFGR